MDFSKFEALENKISAMLAKLASLTEDNEKLAKSLAETKEQLGEALKNIEKAQGTISEFKNEREAIASRLDAILLSIE